MKILLFSVLTVAVLALPARAQLQAFPALGQPQFVEIASGEWRVFPSASAAVAARAGRLSLRSGDGTRSIELELPDGWRLRAGDLSATRFTEMRGSGARTLQAARSLMFVSPDERADLRVRFNHRAEAQFTWSASAQDALAGVSLRYRDEGAGVTDVNSHLRGAFATEHSQWEDIGENRFRLSSGAASLATATPLVQKLLFATYLGGGLFDIAYDLEMTPAGDLLVAGSTSSLDFPSTPGTYDPIHGPGSDAFLLSLSHNGSDLLFGTFFGGGGFDTFEKIAQAPDDSIYLAGRTGSADLPTSSTAFDTELTGESDDHFAHLSADGSTLFSATYIGGATALPEVIEEIFIDARDGSIVFAGNSNTPADWPTTAGSFAPQPLNMGGSESFVTRLAPDLSSVVASTYFGSSIVVAARLLSDGSVVFSIGGQLPNGLPRPLPGGGVFPNATAVDDSALIRMSADLTTVIWSTWVPGIIYRIEEKADGSLVLLGSAQAGFPTTPGAFNPTHDGGQGHDYVVCNITANAERLIWSTYINAGSVLSPADSALDDQERITFVSPLQTTNYPFTPDAYDSTVTAFGEAQITTLDATGSSLLYASSLGVSGSTVSMALDGCGGAFVAGSTNNANLIATPGALDDTYNGTFDGWVLRITTLNPWTNLGFALAGSNGNPRLSPSGPLCEGDPTSLDIADGLAGGSGFLVIGLARAGTPLKGGVLIPAPDFFVPFPLDANGEFSIGFDWPAGAAPGFEFWLQAWMLDAGALIGLSSTNGVRGTTP